MCRPTTCEVCGKTTWKGCGKHIDSVKEQVPPDQWCDKNHTDEEYALAEKKSGFFGSFCSYPAAHCQRREHRDAGLFAPFLRPSQLMCQWCPQRGLVSRASRTRRAELSRMRVRTKLEPDTWMGSPRNEATRL